MSSAPAEVGAVPPDGWLCTRMLRWCAGGQGRPAAIMATVVLAVCQVWLGERYWEPVRHMVFDTYQQVLPRRVERSPVVIVDINEASIAALGQWPWPRTRLAHLLEATQQLGALAVGLDMLMPEVDRLSPSVLIAERPDISPGLQRELAVLPTNDTILAETLRRTPSVVGRAGTPESKPQSVRVDDQTPVRLHGETPLTSVPNYAGHVTNIPPIEAAASGRGYLNTEPDKDGVVRLVPLLVAVHGELAPTFGLELLRVAVGEPLYSVHADRSGVRGVQLGNTFIPTDPDGRRRLYFSKPYAKRHLSALDILHGKAPADALQNTVAIIGVTALGLANVVATPVTAHMDSVEVQAQTLENLLSGTRLVRLAPAPWLEVLAFVVLATVLLALLPRLQPGLGVAVFLGSATLVCAGGFVAFTRWQVLFDPLFAITGSALVLVVLLTAGFAASNRRRRELRAALEAERLERIRRDGELQAARDIQMGLLPAPWAITGLPENLAFHALLEPAKEVGGDLYDAFMLDAHRFFFVVGDVAGKGVPASLFMALSKTLCKSLALRERVPLAALITAVNQEIARDNPAALFVTAVAGILDVRTGDMELCSAGHGAPILLRRGVAPCSLTAASGPPLCILEDFPYASDCLRLQSGDLLLLMTDGVTEAHNPQQMLYGLERVMAYCRAIQDEPEKRSIIAICQGLYDDVKRFAHDAEPSDDIAIMAIRFTAPTCAA